MAIFEVDYSIKDVDKFKNLNKQVPRWVVADSISEALKRAKDFEDDNTSVLKCDLHLNNGTIAIQKKFKGLEPTKENV